MSGTPITTPWKEAVLPPALSVVAPDRVTIRTPEFVGRDVLLSLDGFLGNFDREGEINGEAARNANMYVRVGPNGTTFSGSLRNYAAAIGVVPFDVPFGHREAGDALEALGDAHGLQSGALRDGRLTLLEGAADIVLPRPVADYCRACEDLERTTPYRFGSTTVGFKTDERELKIYDRVARLHASREELPPSYAAVVSSGRHVARVEVTFKSGGVSREFADWKDAEGVVRAGHLADPDFRAYLPSVVLDRTRLLQFGRTAIPIRPGMTPGQRRKWDAVRGITANGGVDRALDNVRAERAAGHLTKNQEKYRLKKIRELFRDPDYTTQADLQAEFEAALELVQTAPSP